MWAQQATAAAYTIDDEHSSNMDDSASDGSVDWEDEENTEDDSDEYMPDEDDADVDDYFLRFEGPPRCTLDGTLEEGNATTLPTSHGSFRLWSALRRSQS